MIKFSPTTLAIDWGSKRLGLAVGRSSIGIRPLPTTDNRPAAFDHLRQLIEDEKVSQIVIGQQADRRFIDRLKRFGRPVMTVDEQLTSQLARGYPLNKAGVDSLAASIILEQYFLAQEQALPGL